MSKGCIAQINYLLNIHRRFDFSLLEDLPALLSAENVDLVLISGDFTTAGGEHEHQVAAAFVDKLQSQQLPCLHVPGNHDHYVRRTFDEGYFRHLYPSMTHKSLNANSLFADRFELQDLSSKEGNPWRIWLLDQCLPTSWISSSGQFDTHAVGRLAAAMKSSGDLPGNWLVCGHFPLHNCASRYRELQGRRELRALLEQHSNVRLYLHGHTHQSHLFDERPDRSFMAIDAGSCTQRRRATFNIYELHPQSALLRGFKSSIESKARSWQEVTRMTWSWDKP